MELTALERLERTKLIMEVCGYEYVAWNNPIRKGNPSYTFVKGSVFVPKDAIHLSPKSNIHPKLEVVNSWTWIVKQANLMGVVLPHPYEFDNCVEFLYKEAKLKRQGRQAG